MQIPPELIERLKLFCEEANLGMTIIGNGQFNVHAIILGSRDYGPNEAALLTANTLINGIVSGMLETLNQQANAAEADSTAKPN